MLFGKEISIREVLVRVAIIVREMGVVYLVLIKKEVESRAGTLSFQFCFICTIKSSVGNEMI